MKQAASIHHILIITFAGSMWSVRIFFNTISHPLTQFALTFNTFLICSVWDLAMKRLLNPILWAVKGQGQTQHIPMRWFTSNMLANETEKEKLVCNSANFSKTY